jgi:hypothetical protein
MGKASRRKKEQRQRRHSGQPHRPAAQTSKAPPRQTAVATRAGAAASPAAPAKPAKPAKATITSTASGAYQEWLREAIRTQRAQMGLSESFGRGDEPHVLAPLVRRAGETPAGRNFMVDLSPVYEPQGTRYMLGLGVSAEDPSAKPDAFGMPQFGPGFAFGLPYELRAVRAGDAVAWLVYRAISDGKLAPDNGEAVAAYAGRSAALATPSQIRLAPGFAPLPSNALFDYEGFGDSAAEDPVSPEMTAAERRSGPPPLPAGNWLVDDPQDVEGRKLAYGIEEVSDFTAGLWVVDQFNLEELIDLLPRVTEERGRIALLTHDLVRAADAGLSEERKATEEALRAGLATPAEIAEEMAPYDALANSLRAAKTVQEVLPVLARTLFELQPPPPPPGSDEVLEGEVEEV